MKTKEKGIKAIIEQAYRRGVVDVGDYNKNKQLFLTSQVVAHQIYEDNKAFIADQFISKQEDKWIDVKEAIPAIEGYYDVKFDDGTTDEKPFRIRLKRNVLGFMTEKNVTHWKQLTDKL